MRPIKLKMNAFGPYKDHTVIDFDKMGERGLFLLTGDTGSGKTMIFDALTFALFGQSSGNNRHMTSFRSHHADPYTESYVELLFSHKGKEYLIKRIPTQMYSKKEGREPTQTLHQVELHLPNGDVISSVTSGNEKVEEILGLDYQQFTQIALIGQGEFRKLLNTDSKERSKIFRKIFNTEFYDKFQDQLSKLNAQARKEYELVITKIKTVFEELDEKEIQIELLDEHLKAIDKRLAENQNKYKTLEKEYQKLQNKRLLENKVLDTQKTLIDEFKALEKLNDALKNLENQKDEINDLEKSLKKLEYALIHVDPLYQRIEEINKKLSQEKDQLTSFQNDLSQNTKALKEALANEAQLTQRKAQVELNKTSIHTLKESLESYEALNVYEKELDKLNASLTNHKQHQKNTQDLLNSENKKKIQLETDLETKDHLEKELIKINETYVLLKELLHLDKVINELHADLKTQNKQLMDAQTNVKEKRDAFNHAEHIFYASQAGLLAQNLKAKEPCPVCGSVDHPSKAKLSDKTVSKEMLDDLNTHLDKAINQRNKIDKNTSELKGRLEENEKQFMQKQNGFENINEEFKQVTSTKKTLELKLERLNDTKSALKITLKTIDDLGLKEKEFSDLINALKLKQSETQTLFTQLKANLKYESLDKAQETLSALMKDVQIYEKEVNEVTKLIKTLNATQDTLSARIEALAESKVSDDNQLESLSSRFKQALNDYGFKDVGSFENILSLTEKKDALHEKVNAYKELLLRENTRKEALEKRLKDKKYPDISLQKNIIKELEDVINTHSLAMRGLSNEIDKEKTSLQRLRNYDKELIEKRDTYQDINGLFKTANAQLTGKDRITFEFYVQTAYFMKVIHEANKRLSIMTQGRYALKLREAATDKRNVTGLDLDVIDFHTNKTREVSTLSGGESFKAALSLALGMSDVIQIFAGGIEIDMLFVDEGFGSLDQESLDQAIEVLNELSSDHRLIGIISHVSELKGRIDKQIVVHKDISGSYVELVV